MDRPSRVNDPYRELFERSADAILIIEGDKFIDCNDATVRMLRFGSRAELLQTHPSELSPPVQPDGRQSFEKANEMMSIAFARGSHRFEWHHQRADGEVFPVEVLLTAIEEPGRRVLHVVWRDISRRKLLEAQARQSSKMEAIGKLAGGVAHDFNNLLVAILGNADLLREHVSYDPEASGHLREIRRAGERAADLVRQLLAFGRQAELRPVVLDLNVLVADTQRLLERLIGEDVQLVRTLAREPLPVEVDRSQLEQVLLNLAANARDAMPAGGRLELETSVVELGARARHGLAPGRYVALRVRDTGEGMDAATLERACEPFFTTKPVGQGTGMGLATVFGIVEQSRGHLSLVSAPGAGTTVEVLLPSSSAPVTAPSAPPAAAEPLAGGGRTVLLAEDDPMVATLVERNLRKLGFEVLACRDGREALDAYLAHAARIELLLSDVRMPNLSGPQLLQELVRRGHRPRVLFMSGYSDEGLDGIGPDGETPPFLGKPFDGLTLERHLRELLADSQRA
ncbi:MAG: response regulator [Planctomycetes bacterium]|nr:response regulator [Planctomycetota bacterium]